MSFRDIAVPLADVGYSVFQLRERGKEPLTTNGLHDATRDERQLLHWDDARPGANAGINLGRSTAFVVDVDPKHGVDPEDAIAAFNLDEGIIVRTGEAPEPSADYPRSLAGVRGIHAYFKGHCRTGKTDVPGVEVRGDGAYVVAPGSAHPSGVLYVGNLPPADELPEAPTLVRELIGSMPNASANARSVGERIPAGERNNTLTSLAGSMRRRGMSAEGMVAALRVENVNRCEPPLPEPEVERIALSVARYPAAEKASANGGANPESATEAPAPAEAQPAPGAPVVVEIARPRWPEPLDAAALHGVVGEIVRLIEPNTEADPVAVLVSLLVMFGNACGTDSYAIAEGERHPPILFALTVGQTSTARKGSALARARQPMRLADSSWEAGCMTSGIVSGEGIVWAVRDPIVKRRKPRKGEPPEPDGLVEEVVDEGIADKRRLFLAREFSAVLKAAAREANTASDVLREAWDGHSLSTLAKNSPASATHPCVSLLAHVTAEDVRRHLTETDVLNGFANRFLIVMVKRSQVLPNAKALADEEFADLSGELTLAIQHARVAGWLRRDEEAEALWGESYSMLTRDRHGLAGAATDRAAAQVLRLSLVYALLDRADAIGVEHLRAALALWRYCEASASFLLGGRFGRTIGERILAALRAADGNTLTRTEIRDVFDRSASAAAIEGALGDLHALGYVTGRVERRGRGRPVERWTLRVLDPSTKYDQKSRDEFGRIRTEGQASAGDER